MSGSESFGSGERFYHGVCPVTLRTRDEAAEAGVTCPRCGLVWCVATWILELEKGPSEGSYLRITFVSSSSDYLDIGYLHSTGCCKTSVKLWKHITETFYGVFLVFLGFYDCQLWAIFHFGTLWA